MKILICVHLRGSAVQNSISVARVSTKALESDNKKPHRLIGSEVSEISCVNQNLTAAPLSSSAVSSSPLFVS